MQLDFAVQLHTNGLLNLFKVFLGTDQNQCRTRRCDERKLPEVKKFTCVVDTSAAALGIEFSPAQLAEVTASVMADAADEDTSTVRALMKARSLSNWQYNLLCTSPGLVRPALRLCCCSLVECASLPF